MNDRFDRKTKIGEVHKILTANGIPHYMYSDLVIGMMLMNCDYIEIVGYGHNAKLKTVKENQQTN